MLFNITVLGLSLISALASAASVAPPSPKNTGNLDPSCPEGSTPGFEVDTYKFDQPLSKFYDVVGSFYNASWYGTEVIGTSGHNNKPGAKRTITYGSSSFNEVLTLYSHAPEKNPKQFIIQYMLETGPVMLTSPPSQFDHYTETLYFSSICGGKATYVSLEATYCGNPERDLYEVYVEVHGDAAKVLKEKTGSREFGGSCPV